MMSTFNTIFPFNNTLVRRFLNWKQGDEEDTWRNKAVDALVKKLKREGQFPNLQNVLQTKREDSPCITLSRSQDGRLQVSHRKMLPHVMYCRIFRWPDLQSQHELRSVLTCQYPAHRREQNKICVNPYHYARVDHSLYPPVVTPRNTEFANASPPPLSPDSSYSQQQSPQHVSQSSHIQSFSQQENPFNFTRDQQLQQAPNNLSIASYYASQSPLSESNSWFSGINGIGYPNSDNGTQSSPLPGYTVHDQRGGNMPMDVIDETQQTKPADTVKDYWCQISYAELNQKIGDPFKGWSRKVYVDGYTVPSHSERFSLGFISHVNRNRPIEMTRRAIGKGICLENEGTQIYVTNLSEASIFFHSKNCNVENQLNQHAVVKIEPRGRQKIFDQKVFEDLVQEAIKIQDGKVYERLYSLTEHGIIKLSFVKGWGAMYHRQDVTSTPCWIEIHLLKYFALIDPYLQQFNPPNTQVTSTS